jgi:deoxycytidine triphosphate deaminase
MQSSANQLRRVPTFGDRRSVSSLITGDKLRAALGPDGFIKDGNPTSVEGAKYDFRMSPLILKSSFSAPIHLDKLSEEQRAQIRVEPGEVVFVRTIERLDLPKTITAVLSTKRKLSHQGIIALGGFCIDPLYKGPLFIGLYNFSSTPFPLQAGKKLIAALFYRLEGDELAEFSPPDSVPDDDFPDDLKNLIRNYKPVELKGLIESIGTIQSQLDALTVEVRDDRTWKRDFQEALERQTKQIDKLLEGLQDEKGIRKEEDAAIRTKLDSMSSIFTTARLIWVIIWTLITLLLGGIVGPYVTKMITGTGVTTPQSAPLQSPLPPATPGKTSP